MPETPSPGRAETPREFAQRLRLSPDTVRAMIRRGELGALNLAPNRAGKPRFVILPKHAEAFEQARQMTPPPKSVRRRKQSTLVDYFPDSPAHENGRADHE